jgi:hypothetical protein
MSWSPTGSPGIFSSAYDLTDPAQVQANEGQTITPEQRGVLASWARWKVVGGFGVGCVLLPITSMIIALLWLFAPYVLDRWPSGDPLWKVVGLAVAVGIALALIWVVPRVVTGCRTIRLVRRDLAAGRVSQAEGRVLWTGRMYEPEAAGLGAPRRLRFALVNRSVLLPPGRYRFYHLPASGMVLSAEALVDDADENLPSLARLGDQPAAPADLRSVLAAVHGHSTLAFERNRLGQLDPAQAARLRRPAIREGVIGAACIGLPWLAVFGFDLHATIIYLICGVLNLIGAWCLYDAWQYLAEARAGRVDMEEGEVTTPLTRQSTRDGLGEENIKVCYIVNDRRFKVSPQAYWALVEGLRYRVYFTPRTRTLVGIEPIEDAPAIPSPPQGQPS